VLPLGVVEKGLEVEVESHDGKQIFNATTGEQGYFLLPNILPRTYYVRRVIIEGESGRARERRGQEVRRLNFTPVPGKVLYVGTLIIDLSERGFSTLREMREDERAKAYFLQTYGTSPWASRAFVASGPSVIAQVAQERATPPTIESKLTVLKIDRPEWKVGDQWRYSWKRVGTSGTLTREVVREDTFAGVSSYVVRVGKNESFYTKDVLGLLATMSGGKVTLKRNAPYQPLSWPLEVGKEWKNSFTLERVEEKSSQTFNHRMVVAKVEEVKVPAGAYEAFKIEVYGDYSGNLLSEYWYSPQVKWFVRTRNYQQGGVREEELLSYKID
jgi:hypothetical protein